MFMKKLLTIIACALAIASCQEQKAPQLSQENAQRDSLQRIIDQKDGEINDMLSTLNEIEEGFRLINAAEGKVSLIKDGESTNKAERIRENIKSISQLMQHNRDLIAKLSQQMRESSVRSEQLKTTIQNMIEEMEQKDKQLQALHAELEQKDIHIAELDKTVNDLSIDVSNLKDESSSKSQTISTQDKQLNTAWYVFGTKKELQEQNIYDKGDVLRSNFNKNYFTKIDIRIDKEIKLYSKSAQILTSHPASSYTLAADANKQYILRITDPQLFWSTSKYLVVLVK